MRFEVASGSASFGGSTRADTTAGPDGIATAPQLLAGATAGPVVVTATAGTATVQFLENVIPAGTGRADLKITVSAPLRARVGETLSVTVRVSNSGTGPASWVKTIAAVPSWLTVVDAGGGTVKGRLITWTVDGLASGSQKPYVIKVKVTSRRLPLAVIRALTGSSTPESSYRNNVALAVIAIRR